MPDYKANTTAILGAFHARRLMTRAEQAEAAHLSRQTLTDLLAGRTCPRRVTLDRLAEVTGLSYADLIVTGPDALCGNVLRTLLVARATAA